ncbi:hypothetical protein CWE21_07080 [Pseudidiomarina aquimaris]|uniref:Uncharacterized protein n=1 Tax=Pseudidiomarina aquimaris TaxID=641841 RepID=A0A432XG11_9GAMM|nr:hypothetical protein CWE21_07080 [Pseudidiomarina aquimaris]
MSSSLIITTGDAFSISVWLRREPVTFRRSTCSSSCSSCSSSSCCCCATADALNVKLEDIRANRTAFASLFFFMGMSSEFIIIVTQKLLTFCQRYIF